ncbi:aminoglycoside phosphotransferase (APT) family kinase protein [Kribbella voronezhensis]|uniref:Aminoglycoside phosphotransferase (APT) family kinase protein n=1 Tax=Kribbella voronezhensis TaxID=2512212 RepID=A0A4R7ST40_9ACTN|nr:aminoglycoside phosphotransferase family protein [Kribbella voronezhensis]TDU82214.1 aminoglycoside phosphotransferase (APT) family kinase protein [Kribbella voronezhensis]
MDILEIDESTVRALLTEQHPDLAVLDLRLVDGGWDNQQWRLGDELAVRMPRTPRAPELLRTEQRWLPVLAPGLPLPIPTPVRIGEPSQRFPRTWTITTWVAGEPADRAPITDPGDAEVLAGFLAALHQDAPADAPLNPTRGVALKTFESDFETWMSNAPEPHVDEIRAIWADALSAPEWDRPPVWVHGDLHPANIVTANGSLAGVIDFGELCAGDPAVDLASAWVLLPAGAAARFFAACATDDATIRRARGWAVFRALALISIGLAGDRGLPGGKPTWRPAGEAALTRLLTSA